VQSLESGPPQTLQEAGQDLEDRGRGATRQQRSIVEDEDVAGRQTAEEASSHAVDIAVDGVVATPAPGGQAETTSRQEGLEPRTTNPRRRPKMGGNTAADGSQDLLRPIDLTHQPARPQQGESMRVGEGVISQLVARLDDRGDDPGVLLGALTDAEEGGTGTRPLEQIENAPEFEPGLVLTPDVVRAFLRGERKQA